MIQVYTSSSNEPPRFAEPDDASVQPSYDEIPNDFDHEPAALTGYDENPNDFDSAVPPSYDEIPNEFDHDFDQTAALTGYGMIPNESDHDQHSSDSPNVVSIQPSISVDEHSDRNISPLTIPPESSRSLMVGEFDDDVSVSNTVEENVRATFTAFRSPNRSIHRSVNHNSSLENNTHSSDVDDEEDEAGSVPQHKQQLLDLLGDLESNARPIPKPVSQYASSTSSRGMNHGVSFRMSPAPDTHAGTQGARSNLMRTTFKDRIRKLAPKKTGSRVRTREKIDYMNVVSPPLPGIQESSLNEDHGSSRRSSQSSHASNSDGSQSTTHSALPIIAALEHANDDALHALDDPEHSITSKGARSSVKTAMTLDRSFRKRSIYRMIGLSVVLSFVALMIWSTARDAKGDGKDKGAENSIFGTNIDEDDDGLSSAPTQSVPDELFHVNSYPTLVPLRSDFTTNTAGTSIARPTGTLVMPPTPLSMPSSSVSRAPTRYHTIYELLYEKQQERYPSLDAQGNELIATDDDNRSVPESPLDGTSTTSSETETLTEPIVNPLEIDGTAQNRALQFLAAENQVGVNNESKMFQRYALLVLYYSTTVTSITNNPPSSILNDEAPTLDETSPTTAEDVLVSAQDTLDANDNDAAVSEWTNRRGFMQPNVDECNWGGVECQMFGDKIVEALDLTSNNLNGTIPYEITYLSYLQILNLGGNVLRGTVPHHLSQLRDLKQLHLYSNSFTGSIPLTLGTIPDMNVIRLQDNDVTGGAQELCTQFYSDHRSGFLGGGGVAGSKDGSLMMNFWSDCLEDLDSGVAEIECSCCTRCCSDTEGCPLWAT